MPETPRDDRPLTRPSARRLPLDHPARAEILDAHEAALERGDSMYADPVTGLFVLTARHLADRGSCCDRGCRHCPYVADGPAPQGPAPHDPAPGDPA